MRACRPTAWIRRARSAVRPACRPAAATQIALAASVTMFWPAASPVEKSNERVDGVADDRRARCDQPAVTRMPAATVSRIASMPRRQPCGKLRGLRSGPRTRSTGRGPPALGCRARSGAATAIDRVEGMLERGDQRAFAGRERNEEIAAGGRCRECAPDRRRRAARARSRRSLRCCRRGARYRSTGPQLAICPISWPSSRRRC